MMTDATYLARRDPEAVRPQPFPPWRWTARIFHSQSFPARFEHFDPVATAFHEAGHALLFVALGMPLKEAAVWSAGGDVPAGACGIVRFGTLPSDRPRLEISDVEAARADPRFTLAIVAAHLAGLQAEMTLAGIALHGTVLYAWSDTDNALSFLALLNLGRSGGLGFCQRYARAALTHNWCAVARVAEELLLLGSLSGERIKELIGDPPKLPGVTMVTTGLAQAT